MCDTVGVSTLGQAIIGLLDSAISARKVAVVHQWRVVTWIRHIKLCEKSNRQMEDSWTTANTTLNFIKQTTIRFESMSQPTLIKSVASTGESKKIAQDKNKGLIQD